MKKKILNIVNYLELKFYSIAEIPHIEYVLYIFTLILIVWLFSDYARILNSGDVSQYIIIPIGLLFYVSIDPLYDKFKKWLEK